MKNFILILVIAVTPLFAVGCSMCCSPYDYDYPTFGGKHERVDPAYGRVGSILSDPMAPRVAGASADSNLLPAPPLKSVTDFGDDSGDPTDDDDMDAIKMDLEEIEPMDGDDSDGLKSLPELEDLEDDVDSSRINKRTKRPLRQWHR
jgi:hypothetical protein